MVKQIVKIEKTESRSVIREVFLGGDMPLEGNRNGVFILREMCRVENEYKHGIDCQCGVCESVGKDEKTIKFIKKARVTHGGKYDYSESMVVRTHDKIIIICPEHGKFSMSPLHHLQKNKPQGCIYCAGVRLTKEMFFEIAKKLHEDKYDYSETIFTKVNDKIKIICPKHGIFTTWASHHISRTRPFGCKKCKLEETRKDKKNKLIIKSKKIHDNKYDYSEVEFVKTHDKVTIICPKHGRFYITFHDHLCKRKPIGCKKCSREIDSKNKRKTFEKFIIESNIVHRNKYDYSKSIYNGSKNKLIIICPVHGEFTKTPEHHINSMSGCRECTPRSLGEKYIQTCLKDNKLFFKQWYKPLGCKNERQLEFDFYIKKYNLCIEFDGRQHFAPSSFGSTTIDIQTEFEIRQKCDKIKNKFCFDNKINLLRIHYKDIKNIQKIIFEAIFKIETSATMYVADLYQYIF